MTPPTERHLTAMGSHLTATGRQGPRQGSEDIVGAIARDRRRVITDLVVLTKPRGVLMVLVTTLVGYYVALPGAADWTRLLHLVVGTVLAAGGTLALNQYIERDVDARMERTRLRPLPDGRLMPLEALLFGSAITGLGLVYLAACVNVLAALVTTVVVVLYLFAYTPLKLKTPLSTLVGAIPGALPPVTGWVAARDDFGLGAAVLFGILFLWQLPHTLAIARLSREADARAGVLVLPVIDEAGASTERQIMTGVLGLLVVSLLPTLIGLAGGLYFAGALCLGLAFAAAGVRQACARSLSTARWVLFASLLYLPVLLALLAFDKA
jgi:protoheme IX farnesyltransferase